MLTFVDQFINAPVLSIRGGRRISTIIEPIIDPHKMRVLGYYVEDRASGVDKVLLMEDIREVGPTGVIVDSEEDLSDPEDLVRIEEILDLNFHLIGKQVVTESNKKIGKIDNYAVDSVTFKIEKIYAQPAAIKALSSNDFIIARRQVAGVNQKQLIVKDAIEKRGKRARSGRASFGVPA